MTGFVRRPGEGYDQDAGPGRRIAVKAFAEDTGGTLGFVEFVHPAGEKINSHVHLRSDEFFYVLEGQCTFRLGEESQVAGPGSFVFVPRGTTHSYSVGEGGGKVVFGFIPGGTEGFFPWVSTREAGTT